MGREEPPAPSTPLASAPLATPAPSGPIMPPPRPQPVLQARSEPVPETRFAELLQQGRILRERGDNANALVRFREANALDPRHPAALTELAMTYERLSLNERAAEHWKRVYDLGEEAGVYFTAAEAKMKQAILLAKASVQGPEMASSGGGTLANATLSLGAVEMVNLRDPRAQSRFRLNVPIALRADTQVNVRDVVIQVLFYDLVEGKPQRTNARVSNRFASAPVDWREDQAEVLEVEYYQPLPDPADLPRENRKYFGYIVRLYYKDELQATRAEPPSLGQTFPASQTLEKTAAP